MEVDRIDRAVKNANLDYRSDWLREAIVEKLSKSEA